MRKRAWNVPCIKYDSESFMTSTEVKKPKAPIQKTEAIGKKRGHPRQGERPNCPGLNIPSLISDKDQGIRNK